MFVLSMKTTRPRLIAVCALMVLLLVTVVSLSGQNAAVATAAPVVADDEARREFLADLGYEVIPDKCEVREILIPVESDPAFVAYNALQQAAGGDLTDYCGKRVKCWTYTVTNYPGEESVQARLYTYKDKVIGGDVSSVAQGGFSHGLEPLTA